jgi:hypothetical protein
MTSGSSFVTYSYILWRKYFNRIMITGVSSHPCHIDEPVIILPFGLCGINIKPSTFAKVPVFAVAVYVDTSRTCIWTYDEYFVLHSSGKSTSLLDEVPANI